MHKPVTPGTVCVKKYFSNGTFTPEECHMFEKIDFNDFFIKIIFFYVISVNNLRLPNMINKSLKDF